MIDGKVLVDWLGPDGAAAGLENSELTVAELLALAGANGVSVPKRSTRAQVIAAIVDQLGCRIDKPVDELLSMDQAKLRSYLTAVRPSRKELLRLLADIDIRPPGKMKESLLEFAAREISDIGLYQRVARGHSQDHES